MKEVSTGEQDNDGREIVSLVPELVKTKDDESLTDNAEIALSALVKAGSKKISSVEWRTFFDKQRLHLNPKDSDAALKAAFYRAIGELKAKNKVSCSNKLYSIAD
jgi:hypothetical protein